MPSAFLSTLPYQVLTQVKIFSGNTFGQSAALSGASCLWNCFLSLTCRRLAMIPRPIVSVSRYSCFFLIIKCHSCIHFDDCIQVLVFAVQCPLTHWWCEFSKWFAYLCSCMLFVTRGWHFNKHVQFIGSGFASFLEIIPPNMVCWCTRNDTYFCYALGFLAGISASLIYVPHHGLCHLQYILQLKYHQWYQIHLVNLWLSHQFFTRTYHTPAPLQMVVFWMCGLQTGMQMWLSKLTFYFISGYDNLRSHPLRSYSMNLWIWAACCQKLDLCIQALWVPGWFL